MKLLTNNHSINLTGYILKRLKGKGYMIFTSPRSPKRTYYLKGSFLKTIRISDHELHERQFKKSQIDIVIQEDFTVTINRETVEPHDIHSYKSVIVDKLLALLK